MEVDFVKVSGIALIAQALDVHHTLIWFKSLGYPLECIAFSG